MSNDSPAIDKLCFFISPIGEDGSETRKRSDQVLKHIIKPAAAACGYRAERADEIDKPGLITSQVIQRVISDPLVIADLTETNPNVFYELAIRHAIRKPLVQIIQKGERIPFDVAGTRTIHVDHQDLDSVAGAKEDIVKQIKELEKNPDDLETPISVSLDLQILRQSENPEDRNFAELISEIAEIRSSISKLGDIYQENNTEQMHTVIRRLEKRLEGNSIGRGVGVRPIGYKSMRLIQEMMMEFNFHTVEGDQDAVRFSLVALVCRDRAPWLYEVAMEVYRQITFGTEKGKVKSMQQFREVAEFTLRHPMFREYFMDDREGAAISEMLERFLFHSKW